MRKSRISESLRNAVIERARGCCEYCMSQLRYSMQSFSIEHVVPFDKGGETVLENLALACQGCNNHKYTKTEGYDPVSRKMAPLYNPRKQEWKEHFAWNDDFTIIVGTSPTGRATVDALRLNRPGLVNLRQLLVAARKHPPFVSKLNRKIYFQ